jgi:hypothetical protein
MMSKKYSKIGQKYVICRASGTAAIVGMAAFSAMNSNAIAATVNWLDPLGYKKPQAIDIVMPNEATVSNKYYVDMSSGSGSTCSQTSPCKNIDDVIGKPGTTGGPAYIYVRGTGVLSLYNNTFYGSPGKEIVIKPWPGYTATFTGNSNTNSTNVHDIIFDGGPDLGIAFASTIADNYSLHILSNNTTIYRTRNYSTQPSGTELLSVGDFRVVSGVRIINNEFYGCNTASGYQCSAVYVGPGDNGGYSNLLIKNNIMRDLGGEGIEVNPRVTSNNIEISGNAIHNVGKQTCSGKWLCRPGITVSIQSGGGNNGTVILNNLIWDTGSSCIWDRGGGNPKPVIYYNTCYDYGKGSGGGGPNPQGISGYINGGTAIVRNNIIYVPNGTDPFDGSVFTASNNLCGSGESCGSSKQTWSVNTVLSTNQNTSNFMQIGADSEVRNNGYTMSSIKSSYTADLRPPYDIGAFVYGTTGVSLQAPTNLKVIQ